MILTVMEREYKKRACRLNINNASLVIYQKLIWTSHCDRCFSLLIAGTIYVLRKLHRVPCVVEIGSGVMHVTMCYLQCKISDSKLVNRLRCSGQGCVLRVHNW